MKSLLLLIGIIANAAGLLAFVAPLQFFDWFADYTGEPNPHLIRDVGAAYITVGVSLMLAAQARRFRFPLLLSSAVFLSLHAVGHILDLITGQVALSHLIVDTLQIFGPALLVIYLAIRNRPAQ